ncbi:MAG: NrfD/PsrC family molybdoenzyme membrane anchor subunit, partial [Dehalococcoidia bacterium]|nr:NrfD/PsrC family molybdoenzyme membrane anchor subunit [Dehalococcoidia bacterium]
AGIFVMLPWVGQGSLEVRSLETLEMALIVSAIIFLGMYLFTMLYSTPGAKEAVRILAAGELSLVFWGGVVVVGLLLPLALGTSVYWGLVAAPQVPALMAAAGLLELLGGFLLRYSLLRVGVFAPVI